MEDKLISALERKGHTVLQYTREFCDKDYDTEYLKDFVDFVQGHKDIDFVISINYIPIISRACKFLIESAGGKYKSLRYISWLCDCPCYSLYSKTFPERHNHTFFFDRAHAMRFQDIYPSANIYYLPGACDMTEYDSLFISSEDAQKYSSDVCFVGSLYSEKGTHERLSAMLPPYLMGYVDGIINAQLNVYGYNFMEESISEEFIEEFKKIMQWQVPPDYIEHPRSVIADYYFGYRATMLDRIKTLCAISPVYSMALYTTTPIMAGDKLLPYTDTFYEGTAVSHAKQCLASDIKGIADTKTMLPKIYSCSKINLEMAGKTFKTGMTLRLFDIMGAGGFVLANYQPEIPEYFEIGKDLDVYESIPDLINKIEYYLTHPEIRMQIAENGHKKVLEHHTYDIRVQEMLELLG